MEDLNGFSWIVGLVGETILQNFIRNRKSCGSRAWTRWFLINFTKVETYWSFAKTTNRCSRLLFSTKYFRKWKLISPSLRRNLSRIFTEVKCNCTSTLEGLPSKPKDNFLLLKTEIVFIFYILTIIFSLKRLLRNIFVRIVSNHHQRNKKSSGRKTIFNNEVKLSIFRKILA